MDPTSRLRVLVVDDQPIVAAALRKMLAAESELDFVYCSDPTQAITMAIEFSPTVILQDLVMPGIDGLELVSAFRKEAATRQVPLVVLSSKEDPEVKVAAFARGANDYLVKLPHEKELLARVRYHSTAYRHLLERDRAFADVERHNRFIRGVFGRYVSDEIVDDLLERPDGLTLGGERRTVTVLMADVRGFTTLSERLAPEQVVALLNSFLETMTEIIVTHGGTIDEILGDAVLVIFGAPVRHADHARRAVSCALDMQLALPAVNARHRQMGLPTLEMGVGVHTGEVVAGNIGSRRRAKYGVVGSPVNLTARIESYTVGGQILVSEVSANAAGADLRIDGTMEVRAKGFNEPVTVYEVGGIGLGSASPRTLPERDMAMIELSEPVPVSFARVDGKVVGDARYTGFIARASGCEAEIQCQRPPRAFSDVRLELPEGAGAIYGKVLPWTRADRVGFLIRFTAIDDAATASLREARSRPAG
ncbi:MAG TPA: adenylate/guanylate cyclase domain-containing protein [Kofleriaceae bacterium]|nr:adenylate/guanylate cyclase domain-containing protein [Kofleriaceae bacterium]